MKAEKEHIDELIVSYLSNELDGNAVHELKEWIAASVENEKYFMQRQEIWFSAISDMKTLYIIKMRLSSYLGNGWIHIKRTR